MQYLVMVKYNENGTPPPKVLLDAIGSGKGVTDQEKVSGTDFAH